MRSVSYGRPSQDGYGVDYFLNPFLNAWVITALLAASPSNNDSLLILSSAGGVSRAACRTQGWNTEDSVIRCNFGFVAQSRLLPDGLTHRRSVITGLGETFVSEWRNGTGTVLQKDADGSRLARARIADVAWVDDGSPRCLTNLRTPDRRLCRKYRTVDVETGKPVFHVDNLVLSVLDGFAAGWDVRIRSDAVEWVTPPGNTETHCGPMKENDPEAHLCAFAKALAVLSSPNVTLYSTATKETCVLRGNRFGFWRLYTKRMPLQDLHMNEWSLVGNTSQRIRWNRETSAFENALDGTPFPLSSSPLEDAECCRTPELVFFNDTSSSYVRLVSDPSVPRSTTLTIQPFPPLPHSDATLSWQRTQSFDGDLELCECFAGGVPCDGLTGFTYEDCDPTKRWYLHAHNQSMVREYDGYVHSSNATREDSPWFVDRKDPTAVYRYTHVDSRYESSEQEGLLSPPYAVQCTLDADPSLPPRIRSLSAGEQYLFSPDVAVKTTHDLTGVWLLSSLRDGQDRTMARLCTNYHDPWRDEAQERGLNAGPCNVSTPEDPSRNVPLAVVPDGTRLLDQMTGREVEIYCDDGLYVQDTLPDVECSSLFSDSPPSDVVVETERTTPWEDVNLRDIQTVIYDNEIVDVELSFGLDPSQLPTINTSVSTSSSLSSAGRGRQLLATGSDVDKLLALYALKDAGYEYDHVQNELLIATLCTLIEEQTTPQESGFWTETVIVTISALGVVVFMGLLIVGLSLTLTPERASSLGIVFQAISTLLGRSPHDRTIVVQSADENIPVERKASASSQRQDDKVPTLRETLESTQQSTRSARNIIVSAGRGVVDATRNALA